MSNIITINNQKLSLKEFKGERVVTFKDIDIVHNRAEGTAGRNFRENKNRFIENVDFFRISPDKIQSDEIRRIGINSPRSGILITESGYLMLVKSFTDDLSWEVQRQLVISYFRQKKEQSYKQLEIAEPYQITPKTYNGQPVVTLYDLERFTGISKWTIRYYLKHTKENVDYFLLTGADLAAFKAENPHMSRFINSLIIVTRKGVNKLSKLIRGVSNDIIPSKTVPSLTSSQPEYPNIKENDDTQNLITSIMKEIGALELAVNKFNKYNTRNEFKFYQGVIQDFSRSLVQKTYALCMMEV